MVDLKALGSHFVQWRSITLPKFSMDSFTALSGENERFKKPFWNITFDLRKNLWQANHLKNTPQLKFHQMKGKRNKIIQNTENMKLSFRPTWALWRRRWNGAFFPWLNWNDEEKIALPNVMRHHTFTSTEAKPNGSHWLNAFQSKWDDFLVSGTVVWHIIDRKGG